MNFNFDLITIGEVNLFLIILARVIGFLSTSPGFSEPYIQPKIKIIISLSLSSIVWINISHDISLTNDIGILIYLLQSFLVGYLGGSVLRIMLSGLQVCGAIISYHIGLANAFVNDPAFNSQASLPANFMMTVVIFLVFISGGHHVLIGGFVESFETFPIISTDTVQSFFTIFPQLAVDTLTNSFVFALRLSSPIIIIGILIYAGMGVVNKLIPQIQVFFIIQPLQLLVGIFILMSITPIVLSQFLEEFLKLITYIFY